jgi:hypothetical protein
MSESDFQTALRECLCILDAAFCLIPPDTQAQALLAKRDDGRCRETVVTAAACALL